MADNGDVLPKELRLSAPPTMPQARSYLFRQRSTLSTYAEKNVIQINIPRLQRSYLTKDSYLSFRVNLTGIPGTIDDGVTVVADTNLKATYPNLRVCLDTCGAYGLIDKIEVYDYLGSTLLESTAGHAALATLRLDGGVSPDVMGGKLSAYAGTRRPMVGLDPDLGEFGYAEGLTVANNFGGSQTVIPPTSGAVFQWPVTYVTGSAGTATGKRYSQSGSTTATNIFREFSIPLFSFLGLNSPHYAPLHNGYTIFITLNSVAQALGVNNIAATGGTAVAGSLSDMSISDVAFNCQVLELGPVAETLLLSSTQGNPLIVHTKAYRNYVSTLGPNTQTFKLDLNLNVASMTAIFWIMRPIANLTGTLAPQTKSLSQRIRNFLQSWYFQYGSSILPQTTGIQAASSGSWQTYTTAMGFAPAFIELMKAFRKNNDFNQATNFNDWNYRLDTSVDQNLLIPDLPRNAYGFNQTSLAAVAKSAPNGSHDTARFACGLDLQLSSENPYNMISGLNTNGMLTSINATFAADKVASLESVQVDAWAEYDAFVNVSPGLATTVSF